jgi:hypothetical protein
VSPHLPEGLKIFKEPAFLTLWYYPIQIRLFIKKNSRQTVYVRLRYSPFVFILP